VDSAGLVIEVEASNSAEYASRRVAAARAGMGRHDVQESSNGEELRLFSRALLRDLRAFEQMLDEGLFETEVRRIGAEQEMFLVDHDFRPALNAMEILELIDDPHFTTELGKFNLECNLDPITLGDQALRKLETQLTEFLAKARDAARQLDSEVILCGILPTLEKSDLTLENITPIARYYALNEAMNRTRGQKFHLYIKGRHELNITHDNVMLEACNTSFQVRKPWLHRSSPSRSTLPCSSAVSSGGKPELLFSSNQWTRDRQRDTCDNSLRGSALGATGSRSPWPRSSRRISPASACC